MTYRERQSALKMMEAADSKEIFCANAAFAGFWQDGYADCMDADAHIAELSALWDKCRMSVKQIAADHGMSMRKLAERFGIPYRTMENWSAGKRQPPEYVLLMMNELLDNQKQ